MSRKPSKSAIAKKAWATRRKNASSVIKSFKVGDVVSMSAPIAPPTPPIPAKTFADCIFEIVNSSMDQSVKQAAFEAMKEAAKTEVVKAY